MRDVAEHIDDYAIDKGRDKSISRKELEVGEINGSNWRWLGFDLDIDIAMDASRELFKVILGCEDAFTKK